jgi:hypothetical protein
MCPKIGPKGKIFPRTSNQWLPVIPLRFSKGFYKFVLHAVGSRPRSNKLRDSFSLLPVVLLAEAHSSASASVRATKRLMVEVVLSKVRAFRSSHNRCMPAIARPCLSLCFFFGWLLAIEHYNYLAVSCWVGTVSAAPLLLQTLNQNSWVKGQLAIKWLILSCSWSQKV